MTYRLIVLDLFLQHKMSLSFANSDASLFGHHDSMLNWTRHKVLVSVVTSLRDSTPMVINQMDTFKTRKNHPKAHR